MTDATPRISVVIPTYGRPQALSACLGALAKSNYDRRCFEVIVVDDGSPAPVDGVVYSMAEQLNTKLVKQANRGPAAARNAGAALARGRILAFTDDDCLPDPDWLLTLDRRHHTNPAYLIGGRTLNLLTENIYSEASQLVIELVYSHYNSNPEQAQFFASNNMALPRQSFLDIGGFNSHFRTAEDRELCHHWRHAGHRLVYAPDAIVRHNHALTLSTFLRQHFRYGRGALHYHRIRVTRKSGKLAHEFSFYRSMPAALRKHLFDDRPKCCGRMLLLLLLWQVSNAAGYGWESVGLP